jgi:hypothetical protein
MPSYLTMDQQVARFRDEAPHPTKDNRYLVVQNDTSSQSGAGWGIYDTQQWGWINFRATEVEAYRLLATILQDDGSLDPGDVSGYSAPYTVDVMGTFVTNHDGSIRRFRSADAAYGHAIFQLEHAGLSATAQVMNRNGSLIRWFKVVMADGERAIAAFKP